MLFKVRTMLCLGPLVWWWSLFPNNFNGENANVWNVNGSNGNFNNNNVNNTNGVRPYFLLNLKLKLSSWQCLLGNKTT